MKRLLNEMLFSLFCRYRRNNASFNAAFHSKMFLAIGAYFYFLSTCLILKLLQVISFNMNFPSSKVILGLTIGLPCYFIIHILTNSEKILENRYKDEGDAYTREGWTYFYLYFGTGLTLFIVLAIVNGGK